MTERDTTDRDTTDQGKRTGDPDLGRARVTRDGTSKDGTLDDALLDGLFAAGRAAPLAPSRDFMARLEAEALVMLPPPRGLQMRPGPSRWRLLLQSLGGWQGATGLVAASAAGLMIGISQPAEVYGLFQGDSSLSDVQVDPVSGFDLALLGG